MQTYTPAQEKALRSRNPEVGFGADLLDADDTVVGDLTPDLVDGEISRDNTATIHGACSLQLLRELAWDTARVRPWQSVNGHRWNTGVYVLTTPEQDLGESPTTFDVDGYDKLQLLTHHLTDTYVVPAGTSCLTAARQAIVDAGVTGLPPLFAGDAQGKTFPRPLVFMLDLQTPRTWLSVVNEILRQIGYVKLWADHNGRFRSGPYMTPAVRKPEWFFDLTDPLTTVVGEDRAHKLDRRGRFNWWRFVHDGMDTRPTEGAGQYTVDRTGSLPGTAKAPQLLRAVDQAALVALGDQQVQTDLQVTRTLELSTGPLPILGHDDVWSYADAALGQVRALTRTHKFTLSGDSDTEIEAQVVT